MKKRGVLKNFSSFVVGLILFFGLAFCVDYSKHTAMANDEVVEVSTYEELISAFENASEDSEIVVTQQIELPDGVGDIDGHGATVSVVYPYISEDGVIRDGEFSNYCLFHLSEGRSATIKNMVIVGGMVTGNNDANSAAVFNAGTLTMENVTITRSYRGLNIGYGGTAILKNCNIVRNVCTYAGGILCNGGKIIMDGCSLSENYAMGTGLRGGGAIEIKNQSEMYANNTVIINNSAGEIGGAINCYKSNLWLMNCTITGNVTTYQNTNYAGGGVGLNCTSGGSTIGAFYAVNTIIADNYSIINNEKTRSDIGIYSNVSASNIINCLYGNVTKKPTNDTLTFNEYCKVDTSNTFAVKYRQDGVLIKNDEYTVGFPHPAATTKKVGSPELYVPVKLGNEASSGGARTYFDYSDISNIKMGYGEPDSILQFGGLSAPDGDAEVVTYYEGGTRALGVIGASKATDGAYYTVTLVRDFENGSVFGATIYGDTYLSGTEITIQGNPDSGYELGYWVCYSVNTESNTNVSDNPYQLTVVEDVVLTPVFREEQIPPDTPDDPPDTPDDPPGTQGDTPEGNDLTTAEKQGLSVWIIIVISLLALLVILGLIFLIVTHYRKKAILKNDKENNDNNKEEKT